MGDFRGWCRHLKFKFEEREETEQGEESPLIPRWVPVQGVGLLTFPASRTLFFGPYLHVIANATIRLCNPPPRFSPLVQQTFDLP